MPSPTFTKLPAAKREKFILVAMEEFSSAGYEKASITKMVKKLRIAKGSVYQYFENKKDLYFYLLDMAQAKRQEYLKPVLRNPPDSFFDLYVQVYLATLKFDFDNQEMSSLLSNASYEKYADDLGNLMLNQKKKSMDFMRGLLERELLRGGLRFDVDIDVMAYFASNISTGIWDYIRMNSPEKKNDKLPRESAEKLLGDLSKLLKSGLKA